MIWRFQFPIRGVDFPLSNRLFADSFRKCVMTKIVTTQKEDISEKLRFIDTLDVSQDQKDALKKYVELINMQTTFYTDDNTLVAQIN